MHVSIISVVKSQRWWSHTRDQLLQLVSFFFVCVFFALCHVVVHFMPTPFFLVGLNNCSTSLVVTAKGKLIQVQSLEKNVNLANHSEVLNKEQASDNNALVGALVVVSIIVIIIVIIVVAIMILLGR